MRARKRIFWHLMGRFAVFFGPLFALLLLVLVASFRGQLSAVLSSVLVIAGGAFVAAGVVAYLAARRIDVAVTACCDVLSRIAAGDYDGRIPVGQRDVLEPLVETTDSMRKLLRSRYGELQANRDQLRTVLDSMVEGVIAVDEAQRVLLVNDSACRLFRFQEALALGRPLWEVVRNPQLQQWVSQSLVQPEPVGGELELVAPASRVLLVRAAGLPSSNTPGAVVVASDMSQLRRLERVRQEFVANASHELKTPLASIKACVETLLDGAIDDPEHRVRFLNAVSEQSERLDRLVRDLLSLTRIESEGVRRDLQPISVAEAVAACVEGHRQQADRKSMRLMTVSPPEPLTVLADDESLEQILDNLVDNAIKYTNDGGQVTIRWCELNGSCLLDVEDTGIGIPQSQLARIFERFYRVDRARSRELGGTGLGLSIVKHLVQNMGGTVTVNSRLGKGSIFSIQLRLCHQVDADSDRTGM